MPIDSVSLENSKMGMNEGKGKAYKIRTTICQCHSFIAQISIHIVYIFGHFNTLISSFGMTKFKSLQQKEIEQRQLSA